jgi:hypothetical protein
MKAEENTDFSVCKIYCSKMPKGMKENGNISHILMFFHVTLTSNARLSVGIRKCDFYTKLNVSLNKELNLNL